MARLQDFSDEPILKSSLWQTSPVDCPPVSRKFVNAVVGLVPRADETPESLLAKLQALEKEFGREPKKILNEPRPLDLDLIAFGNEIRNSPELILPHPRAHLRRFVLQPLSEIAPDLFCRGKAKRFRNCSPELTGRAKSVTTNLSRRRRKAADAPAWRSGRSCRRCSRTRRGASPPCASAGGPARRFPSDASDNNGTDLAKAVSPRMCGSFTTRLK